MPTTKVETNADAEKIWNRINHTDVENRIDRLEKPLLARAKERFESVHFSEQVDDFLVIQQFVKDRMHLLGEMVSLYLNSYRLTWEKQGGRESRGFWDCMRERVLIKVFDWNEKKFKQDFEYKLYSHGMPIGGFFPEEKHRRNRSANKSKPSAKLRTPMTQEQFRKAIMKMRAPPDASLKEGAYFQIGFALFKEEAEAFQKALRREIEIEKPFEDGFLVRKPKGQHTSPAKVILSIPPLEKLKEQKSLREIQAARVFAVASRTIRHWKKKKRLTSTPSGRIVTTDAKFEKEYNLTHSPKPK